jgi:hypothetical protein
LQPWSKNENSILSTSLLGVFSLVMRRATSMRVALHPCKQQSAPHIPWHNSPPPRRTSHRTAGERLPWASHSIPSQPEQRMETIRRDPEDVSLQKRILNVRPWKRDYTLLHAMAFVRELERRFGRVSHIYLIKVSRSEGLTSARAHASGAERIQSALETTNNNLPSYLKMSSQQRRLMGSAKARISPLCSPPNGPWSWKRKPSFAAALHSPVCENFSLMP